MPLITAQSDSGASVALDSELARELRNLIHLTRPRRILETGTLHATGTTRIIGEALKEFGINGDFRSIEVSPENCEVARANIAESKLPVQIECGLSIPFDIMPTLAELETDLAELEASDELYFVDHDREDRAAKYISETENATADDLIGKVLSDWDGMADLIVLDSAGHLGYREFVHATALLRGACWFVLDDCAHLKHLRSRRAILGDMHHFRVAVDSPERFGFLIAHYTP